MFDEQHFYYNEHVVSRKPSMVSLGDTEEPQMVIPAALWSSPVPYDGLTGNYSPETLSDQSSYLSSAVSYGSFYSPQSASISPPLSATEDHNSVYGWGLDNLHDMNSSSAHAAAAAVHAAVSAAAVNSGAMATAFQSSPVGASAPSSFLLSSASFGAGDEPVSPTSTSFSNGPLMPPFPLDSEPNTATNPSGASHHMISPARMASHHQSISWSPIPMMNGFVGRSGAASAHHRHFSDSFNPRPVTPIGQETDYIQGSLTSSSIGSLSSESPLSQSPTPGPQIMTMQYPGDNLSSSTVTITHDNPSIGLAEHEAAFASVTQDFADDKDRQNEIIRRMSYSKWVKLSRMTDQRVGRIKTLAREKNIDIGTVESVLTLYTTPQADNEVNRFDGEDVYLKITMGSGAFVANVDDEVGAGADGLAKKKKHRRQKPHYIKRPLNSFMLYRKSQTQSAMAYAMSSELKLNHQNISQIIGLMWQTESKELKEEFARFASQEKELHKALHPDYKFCPQKKKKSIVA